MSKIVIDGNELDVPAEYTLLQACEAAGAEIPRFCFHERLSIAGNCRMCLIEVKGGPPKPTASCAMSVRDLRPGPKGEPPVVKTSMNRCIQCTRCVRFATEVAGVSEIGAIGRGEDMEITTYLERALTSELQGNVVDLCPVGALTSKPRQFHGRSWEFVHTESVDVMDALGS